MIGSHDTECSNGCGTEEVIFDSYGGSFYHSERIETCGLAGIVCSLISKCERSGITINFQENIEYVDLRIFTRQDCCPSRYKNVCIYGDGNKISCTPAWSSFQPSEGSEINFKDYNYDGSGSHGSVPVIYAKEFSLIWEAPYCAQIAELYIDYKGKCLRMYQWYSTIINTVTISGHKTSIYTASFSEQNWKGTQRDGRRNHPLGYLSSSVLKKTP